MINKDPETRLAGAQFSLGALLFGDIAPHPNHAVDLAGRVANRDEGVIHLPFTCTRVPLFFIVQSRFVLQASLIARQRVMNDLVQSKFIEEATKYGSPINADNGFPGWVDIQQA